MSVTEAQQQPSSTFSDTHLVVLLPGFHVPNSPTASRTHPQRCAPGSRVGDPAFSSLRLHSTHSITHGAQALSKRPPQPGSFTSTGTHRAANPTAIRAGRSSNRTARSRAAPAAGRFVRSPSPAAAAASPALSPAGPPCRSHRRSVPPRIARSLPARGHRSETAHCPRCSALAPDTRHALFVRLQPGSGGVGPWSCPRPPSGRGPPWLRSAAPLGVRIGHRGSAQGRDPPGAARHRIRVRVRIRVRPRGASSVPGTAPRHCGSATAAPGALRIDPRPSPAARAGWG